MSARTLSRSLALLLGLWAVGGPSRPAQAVPIRTLPGLTSVIVYERSTAGGPDAYAFAPGSSQVLNRIAVLSDADNDFSGFTSENYDLYYSNAAGTPDADGAYLTVDGLFAFTNDAGYNVAEVALDFGGILEFAEAYTRVNSLGAFAIPSSADLAIDADLDTHSFLGDSTDQSNRLSMTFQFASAVPEPSAPGLLLAALGLAGAALRRS